MDNFSGSDPRSGVASIEVSSDIQIVASKAEQKGAGRIKHLQEILWEESLQAVRLSLECESRSVLAERLRNELSQNSATTRDRYTTIILSRFFPETEIDNLPRRLLRAYNDEQLLADAMAVLLLLSEPVVGRLIADRLHSMELGSEISTNFFTGYGQEIDGRNAARIAKRCSTAARVLGWIARQRGKSYRAFRPVNPTAALLLFHWFYAPSPQIVELSRIFSEPIWKYLAFRDPAQVRTFCRSLEQKQLIARYVQVDRLDQITTRYTAAELLERKIRL
jgi:hypothetical protein